MGKSSSWETTSGLLEEYDFKVDEAWFGPNEDSDRDPEKIFLNLRGEAKVDGEVVDDEHTERYSVGKNWEVVEDGAEVENATGKNQFNENTGTGRLIRAMVACGDGDAVAKYLQGKGEAYEASTFEGLNMEMERMLASEFESDDGETVRWFLSLPVEVKIKAAKKAKKGGKGKASRGKGKDKKSSLRSDIIAFAKEFDEDEHDEFVDQVLDEDTFPNAEKIEDDDELHAEVLDPDSELWSDAH